jgi:hypothetical protein
VPLETETTVVVVVGLVLDPDELRALLAGLIPSNNRVPWSKEGEAAMSSVLYRDEGG